jgi:hypothetical protein
LHRDAPGAVRHRQAIASLPDRSQASPQAVGFDDAWLDCLTCGQPYAECECYIDL